MKRKWGIGIVFLIGFLLCSCPLINNLIEHHRQTDIVSTYKKAAKLQEDRFTEMIKEAVEYNDMLFQSDGALIDGMDSKLLSDDSYDSLLDISGTGTMGCLDIPKIDVELPIYHGTDNDALSNGVGHLRGTSLPVGGENTHCVLTGHRGLPSSKLLVRLDEIEKGDLLFIRLGNKTLAYKTVSIRVVEPEDLSSLRIRPEEDLLSVVTCTPYGINTKRLIVTGKRVGYKKTDYDKIQEKIPSVRELIFTLIPLVFLMIVIVLFIIDRRRSYHKKK